jgi:LCP family protein required for cell wall assembly
MGRATAANGNGRAVLPPLIAPPITRYRQPEPGRRGVAGLLGRIVLGMIAAAVMVASGIAGGYYLYLNESAKALRPVDVDVKKAQKQLAIPPAGAPTTALIVGYDHRLGPERSQPSRSDTIMLLRADPQTDTISMLSFPRDLTVTDICPGQTFTDRINAAYAVCGARGTLATVKNLTGLQINYLITVNFAGFKQIVDRVGGVWIDVDRRYFNRNVGTAGTNYANINLLPGYQKLKGQAALDYVRFRHTDSDLYRLARQQQFVRALKEQITHSFIPFSVPRIVGAITRNHNVQVARGGSREIDLKTVVSYAFFAYRLPPGHLFQAKIQNVTGTNTLYAPPTDIQSAIDDFKNPDVQVAKKATAVALGRKLRLRTGPRPANVSIVVLNGSGKAGAAGNGGYLLAQRGYQIVTSATGSGNAPNFGYFHTQIYYDPRVVGSRLAAASVAKLFVDGVVTGAIPPELKPMQNGAMLVVVVGHTFDNVLAPSPRDQTPKKQPPYVRADPAASLALVRAAQRRLPFRLMVPSVLERASQPASEIPARVYWTGPHRALRLTYKTSADIAGYWGIQETNWTDAPVLQGPNEKHWFGGREFDFYYSGPNLHMVVLRLPGVSYWVVNTLRDTLSNETMIAIARGLRPFRG